MPAGSGAAAIIDEVALSIRTQASGISLALIADSFFWAAWIFAFFYLRAFNSNQTWLPKGVATASKLHGGITLATVVVCVGLYFLASRLAPTTITWRWLAMLSLLFGLGGAWFQAWGMWNLGFGITNSAYTAVFAGWMGLWILHFFVAMFWLLTVIMQARPGGDTYVRPWAAVMFSRWLIYLGAIYLISYIVLYFIH
jgi:heme/copper-type cytochrome/quinol oxidase subunit 3